MNEEELFKVSSLLEELVLKLSELIFTYYKSWAASELLDPSFLFALDNGEKYVVQPMRFNALLMMIRVKVLGRTIDLRSLIAERMNKMFRDNLEFLFDRFESRDMCAIVLLDILKLSHELLSKDFSIDSFNLMMNEMQENISLVSFYSRLASQLVRNEEKQPSDTEVKEAIWEVCGDSGALQLLIDLLQTKLIE